MSPIPVDAELGSIVTMSGASPIRTAAGHVGPHPSFIQVARPYIFEHKIQECLTGAGLNEVKEDSFRLQGVAWLDSVRKALQLPVRTFNTAAVYYHKFRLAHPDNEYNYADAAAAALFTACKIEDTLKKSKDMLCAAYNLKLPPAEQLSPDDPIFESHSKAIIGLERLMLEASAFDFRNRHPQRILVKLAKKHDLDRTVAKTAFDISIDLYRTFIPLKQTSSTMAIACLELALKLHKIDPGDVFREGGIDYNYWSTSREEIMETLLDLLDLYTHHRPSTSVGPQHGLDSFLAIRITLNQEAMNNRYPRFTQSSRKRKNMTNGNGAHKGHRDSTLSPKARKSDRAETRVSPQSTSPTSPSLARGRATERGREGTVRFMLEAERAREERAIVAEYFKVDEEVYEVEEENENRRG